nr:ATP-binding protein [Gilvimarinus xylanilyticus]
MTYAVSHELRTPLARMKFALEIAQDSQDAQTVARQLSNVRDDVNDMDALINQLLGYAGFEAQSQQLVLQAEPAGALIDMAREMSERLRQRHPRITFTFANALAEHPLFCEWHLMERVLQNLLGNAVRYAEGQVWVQLSANESGYCLAVEDDGPGIAPADRARVFDSFTRLKQLPGKDTKGFGLGLAIVNRIISWHNGEVRACEPKRLTGARFECRWPAPAETKL